MKVRAGYKEGVVPASYVELLATAPPTPSLSVTATTPTTANSERPNSTYSNSSASLAGSIHAASSGAAGAAAKKKGPAVAPRRGAKKLKYAEALYDYVAQSEQEHSIVEGERFVLINRDGGDGWADVEKEGQVKSVPAAYIQEV